MKNLIHLFKLNEEKILTYEEFESAILSYCNGDMKILFETIISNTVYNLYIKV